MPLGSAENPPEMGEKGGGEYDLAIGLAVTEAEARRSHSSHLLASHRVMVNLGKGNHTPVASNGKPMCLFNRQPG